MRYRIRCVAMVLCGVTGLSSCDSSIGNEVEHSEASLDGVVAAIYVSPQTNNFAEGATEGYVLLVSDNGSYQSIVTSGMDTGELVWTDEGLFFSDRDADYLLNTSMIEVRSAKTEAQFSAFRVAGRDVHVGVYNEGMTGGGGYRSQVVVTKRGGADRYPVEGFYGTNALCGNEVYGIADDPGRHAKEPGSPSALSRPMLARLYPPADGAEKVIGWQPAGREPFITSGEAPCRDGKIVFITQDDDQGRGIVASVATWDVRTGRFRSVPLTDESGGPFAIADYDGAADYGLIAQFGSESLDPSGALHWYAPSGHILVTDPTTGVTTVRFDTGYGTGGHLRTQVEFTADSVALVHDANAGSELVFKRFDRRTGDVVEQLTIPDVGDRLSASMVMRGLAVRPEA